MARLVGYKEVGGLINETQIENSPQTSCDD